MLAPLMMGILGFSLLTGCGTVPKGRLVASEKSVTELRQQVAGLQQHNNQLVRLRTQDQQEADQLREALAADERVRNILEQRVDNLSQENERLNAGLTSVVMRAGGVKTASGIENVSTGPQVVALDENLQQEITQWSLRHEGPTFEPSSHVVRLPASFLFFPNEERLRPIARASLAELADLLNKQSAKPFTLQVVGHSKLATVENVDDKKKINTHPDDWKTSAHHAILVEQVLQQQGINPARLGVISYAGYQPLGKSDQIENSRVEIFLINDSQK